MLGEMSEVEFWELLEETAQEPPDSGPCGPPKKDREKRFKERSDYPQIFEAAKETSDEIFF